MIDLKTLLFSLLRGIPQSLAFAAIFASLAILGLMLVDPFLKSTTSTRVVFSFPGFEKNQYPDGSRFQPEDLRSPDVLVEALKRRGHAANESIQGELRAALSVEGIIPPEITKQRDKLRSTGATPPPYTPDEYALSLSLPNRHALTKPERKALLAEMVTVYKEKFTRTYSALPKGFGGAFAALQNADYFEFGFVLQQEVESLRTYLKTFAAEDKSFRSPRTNLSFNDLLDQLGIFAEIDLYETLSEITLRGATREQKVALMKIDYQMRLLKNRELHLLEQEKLVRELLAKAETRQQDYVVGMKSQVSQQNPQTPVLDQGLVDSLLANDSNNFFLRQAMEAGLKVKAIQSEMSELADRRRLIEQNQDSETERTRLFTKIDASVKRLQGQYNGFIERVRLTRDDYATQRFGDALRFSDEVRTDSVFRKLALYGAVGVFLGLAFGSGLALLGIFIGRKSA